MKKIFLMIILMLSVIMCGIVKDEDEKIDKNNNELPKKIIVGLDDTFAPMGFKNEKGELIGFDIDLSREVAKKLGMEIEYKSINWDSKILELNAGNIDLIWSGLTITPERAEQTSMSKPYLSNNQIVITRVDENIKKIKDLDGKVVGSQNQSSGEEIILKNKFNKNFKEFKSYAQYDQAFMDLDLGRLDAIVVDEVFAKYIKNIKEKQKGKELYYILDENFGKENMGIAAKKGNVKLIEAIDKTIEEFKNDGTYKKIYDKWFSE